MTEQYNIKKYLVSDRSDFTNLKSSWTYESHAEYFKKRIRFWQWRLHRTTGRPILVPRKRTGK